MYLLGAEETNTAPLVCALTGHIAREARRIAAHQPGGRLDPPLTLALDEAALISPVPLDRWSADMGGRGVCIVAAFQSRAQLVDRFSEARAATTINNAGAKVVFGGTGDRDDLNHWSTLAGNREEPVISRDLHGRGATRTTRQVPVLAPAQLAQLPPHKVVAFTSGMPPVIGQADRAWRRPDVRAVLEPNAAGVRARAAAIRLTAVVTSWLMWPERALVRVSVRGYRRATAVVPPWIAAQRAAWARRVGGLRTRVVRRPASADDTARVGPEVVPFPTTWPDFEVDASPAVLPASEWPNDNGPGDEHGRWN